MRQGKFLIAVLMAICGLDSCISNTDKLVVATAANTQFALQEIVDDFSEETGIPVDLIISSSGKHTAQIMAGAPYDVFISADLKYPEKLFDADLTTAKPEIYAFGKLVLWSIDTNKCYSLNQLVDPELTHIAVPNPKTAPYGLAAREVLEQLDLWQDLQAKLVFGESIAQANQYITSGAVATGFTASSIVMAPQNKNKGRWVQVPDSLYTPIAQGVVCLKSSTKPEQAKKFYQYLLSERSENILKLYGYSTHQ